MRTSPPKRGSLGHRLATALRLLCANATQLARDVRGQSTWQFVFSCDPRLIAPPAGVRNWTMEKLSDDAVFAAAAAHPQLRSHRERIEETGFNDAWGLRIDGALASVGWLTPATQ